MEEKYGITVAIIALECLSTRGFCHPDGKRYFGEKRDGKKYCVVTDEQCGVD
jgi:hypothetical protein